MKRLITALFALLVYSVPAAVLAQLDTTETNYLLLMREEEKLARDTYTTLYDSWSLNIFNNISKSEQKHMDAILTQLNRLGIEDPVKDNTTGVFTNETLAAYFTALVDKGQASLLDALHVGAYIEELDIADLWDAIDETDDATVVATYENLLAGSRNHLRSFVSQIGSRGVTYQAQYLDQQEVDAIVGGYDLVPENDFEINAGLNDAWFYPNTAGQGFFITVYPDSQVVFLSWFTYDTAPAADTSVANLGAPGQRWLTAQGSYDGAQADLMIQVSSGGIFDSGDPEPASTPDGSILLQFNDCNSGSITYDIPSIGQNGVIPIQRIALDNVVHCENLASKSAAN